MQTFFFISSSIKMNLLLLISLLVVYYSISYIILNSRFMSLFLSIFLVLVFPRHKAIPLILSYYLILSWIEWFTHRYIMHEIPQTNQGHINHHMSISPNMNASKKGGEIGFSEFDWVGVFGLTCAAFMLSFYYFWKIYNVEPGVHFLTLLGAATLVATIWNNIHNPMHCEDPKMKIFQGPPSIVSKDTARSIPGFSLLYRHHQLHHVVKEPKGNFNIVCLGMDRIMGTKIDGSRKITINSCE